MMDTYNSKPLLDGFLSLELELLDSSSGLKLRLDLAHLETEVS